MPYVKDSPMLPGAKDSYEIQCLRIDIVQQRIVVEVRVVTMSATGVVDVRPETFYIQDGQPKGTALFSQLAASPTSGDSLYDEIKAATYSVLAAKGEIPPTSEGWEVV